MYVFRTTNPIEEQKLLQMVHIREEDYTCYEMVSEGKRYFCYSKYEAFPEAAKYCHTIDFHQRGNHAFVLEVTDGTWHSELFAKYLSAQYHTEVLILKLPTDLTHEKVQAISSNASLLNGEGEKYIRFEEGGESVLMRIDPYDGELHLGIPTRPVFKEKLVDFVVQLYGVSDDQQKALT